MGIAVRESGRFDVYSDFILVYSFFDPDLQCVDIETDFNMFYLKFVKNSLNIKSQIPLDELESRYELR